MYFILKIKLLNPQQSMNQIASYLSKQVDNKKFLITKYNLDLV